MSDTKAIMMQSGRLSGARIEEKLNQACAAMKTIVADPHHRLEDGHPWEFHGTVTCRAYIQKGAAVTDVGASMGSHFTSDR
jgi:hypothetical protein